MAQESGRIADDVVAVARHRHPDRSEPGRRSVESEARDAGLPGSDRCAERDPLRAPGGRGEVTLGVRASTVVVGDVEGGEVHVEWRAVEAQRVEQGLQLQAGHRWTSA